MAASLRARKAIAAFCLVGAPSCSLFVSLDGLSDGSGADAGGALDASNGSDGSTTPDSAITAESGVDAHVTTPPVFRSLSTASNSGESVTVARAPQIQAGDLMIALVYEYQDSSMTTPPDATWQPVVSFHDPAPSYEVHYFERFATATEPNNFTFATTGLQSGYASVTLLAYSGVDPAHPIELSAAATAENVPAYTSTSVTPTISNTLLMVSAVADGQSAAHWTAPANVTPRLSDGYVFVGDIALIEAGVAATETITCGTSSGGSSGGIAAIGVAPQ